MFMVKFNNGGSAHIFAENQLEVEYKSSKFNSSGIKEITSFAQIVSKSKLDDF
jgi:hypothetical protein